MVYEGGAEFEQTFRQESLFRMAADTTEKTASENLPNSVGQHGAAVIVMELAALFPLAETDNRHLLGILDNLSVTPHLLIYRRQLVD
nr:unnamed protein product [Spirometra erinaceieuropaei]